MMKMSVATYIRYHTKGSTQLYIYTICTIQYDEWVDDGREQKESN